MKKKLSSTKIEMEKKLGKNSSSRDIMLPDTKTLACAMYAAGRGQ